MVPVSELVARVRRRYDLESGGASTRFSDTAIMLYLSEALENLAEETGFYERYVTVPVVAGRTYYDLRGFGTETAVSITSVWSTERNDWLKPESPEILDTTWKQSVGNPQIFWHMGVNWIGVYPKSQSTSGYFRIYFQGIPSRFTHPQAILGDLPDNHTHALEDYALYEMAAADRQTKRALLYWAEYQRREKALHDFVDRRIVGARAGALGRLAGRLGG